MLKNILCLTKLWKYFIVYKNEKTYEVVYNNIDIQLYFRLITKLKMLFKKKWKIIKS